VRSGIIRIETTTCDAQEVGTGFLVSPNLVATVEHVVDGEAHIVLKQNGKALSSATVIGFDPARDLALLRTAKPIPGYVFKLAGRAPRLGEEVAALGFPLGLPLTVTKGSVSGLGRTIPIANVARRQLVQTDAALNHGNSGGPLLATDTGEVGGLFDIGSNFNGISFAVSSQVAKPLLGAWQAAPQPISAAECAGGNPHPVATPQPPASTNAALTFSDYSNHVDRLLASSAAARKRLSSMAANGGSNNGAQVEQARTDLLHVISARQALLNTVETWDVPPVAARVNSLLQKSLAASLASDQDYLRWVEARLTADTSQAHAALTTAAADDQQATSLNARSSVPTTDFANQLGSHRFRPTTPTEAA
jgi:hypothetical protein